MSLLIPDDVVQATRMSEDELRLEFAVFLFQLDKLTLGQASELARVPQEHLLRILASRRIAVHYGVAELERDLETLAQLHSR